jgi:glycosyltransferase involved in cell wall biosynthesis
MIASNLYPPYVVGGAEVVVEQLAEWLGPQGHAVTVVSTCDKNTVMRDVMQNSVRVIRYFPPNLWWNFVRFNSSARHGRLAKALWNLRDAWNLGSARQFGAILDDVKPDVLHTHNIKGMSPAIWREATRRGIPIVHTIHDYYLLCHRGSMQRDGRECVGRCSGCSLYGRWQAAMARRIATFVSPSAFVGNRHKVFGVSPSITVIPNGVSGQPVERLPSPAPVLKLLFIGQLRHEKGAHLLSAIMERVPSNVHLDIAGTGPCGEQLASAMDDRIAVHGFVRGDVKQRLLNTAHVLLFPSLWTENAPLVLAEAFMSGLPVIASNIGAIPEFVRHEQNGLLCEPGNIAAFAEAIVRLQASPEFQLRLSHGASAAAHAYSAQTMGQLYEGVYKTTRKRTCP